MLTILDDWQRAVQLYGARPTWSLQVKYGDEVMNIRRAQKLPSSIV